MVAKGGARLIDPAALDALKRLLIARAEILTPNLPEAEILCGATIGNIAEMRAAGESLLALGCRAVLVKGGHLPGETVSDVLVTASAPGSGRARGSRPAILMAPAALSPRRSRRAWPKAWTSKARSSGPATTSSARSPARRAWDAATGRSTTPIPSARPNPVGFA